MKGYLAVSMSHFSNLKGPSKSGDVLTGEGQGNKGKEQFTSQIKAIKRQRTAKARPGKAPVSNQRVIPAPSLRLPAKFNFFPISQRHVLTTQLYYNSRKYQTKFELCPGKGVYSVPLGEKKVHRSNLEVCEVFPLKIQEYQSSRQLDGKLSKITNKIKMMLF